MFEEVRKKWSKLDILVNNAGVVEFSPFESITEEQWDKILDVNLKGQFLCSKAAVKIMGSGARIINIASIASGGVGVGFANTAHYTASKGGVVALTENMAIDLGKKGVNVNAVGPGVIETDMTKAMLGDEKTKAGLLARIPKGRMGKPEDIGAAVAFLASDEADYITGAVLYVDGGWLAG
jgi:NAD(P)-dependent dehydrogenase (short-subunit alcohol dehydrogenase family)